MDRPRPALTSERRTGHVSGRLDGRVRLAELVAALSLGIDLGFGQPMEHVLRQCLIAIRLAERSGLAESARGDVYYTALLVNVGCHTDAHEQAKWFGDDIAMKADKYSYELRSVRMAAAGMLARERAGKQFDPALAAIVEHEGDELLAGLDEVMTWDAVIDAEPALGGVLTGEHLDTALAAIANFVDLKSPYSLGHAPAV